MTDHASSTKLVLARETHRDFVRRLSAEVFERFGDYDTMLPEWMSRPWVWTFIAEAADEPVGFAMFTARVGGDAEVELLAIAVSPAWQVRGVGRLLLEQVERTARKLAGDHAASIQLTVAEDNLPARRLFEKSGFVPIPGERGSYPAGQVSMTMSKQLEELEELEEEEV